MYKNIMKVFNLLLYISVISFLPHLQCNAAEQLQINWGWQLTVVFKAENNIVPGGVPDAIVLRNYFSGRSHGYVHHQMCLTDAVNNAATEQKPGVASVSSFQRLFETLHTSYDEVFYHRSLFFIPQSSLKAAEPSTQEGKVAINKQLRIHEDTEAEINHFLTLGKVSHVRLKLEEILQETPWMNDNKSILRLNKIVKMYEENALISAKKQLTQLTRRLVFEGEGDELLQLINEVTSGFDEAALQILNAHRESERQKAESVLARFLERPQLQALELQLRRELAVQFLGSNS
ncbi:MAG: hypothetical protein HEEMFOPI_00265 [Holosporales bacterium]